jgi:hypothetical protein
MGFGQLVIGAPGSGKTTYCHGISQVEHLTSTLWNAPAAPAGDWLRRARACPWASTAISPSRVFATEPTKLQPLFYGPVSMALVPPRVNL